MEQPIWGVEKVEIGTPGANGGAATNWVTIKDIEDDSVSIDVPTPTTTDIRVEDKPGVRLVLPGDADATTVNIGSIDMSGANLARLTGGTFSGDTYSAPIGNSMVYKAIRITTKLIEGKKMIFLFPLTVPAYSFNGNITRTGVVSVRIAAKVLTPTNGSGVQLTPWTMQEVTGGASVTYDTIQSFASATNINTVGVNSTIDATDADAKLEFNAQNPYTGTPSNMVIKVGTDVQLNVAYNSPYNGQPFRWTSKAGIAYGGSFAAGDVVVTAL